MNPWRSSPRAFFAFVVFVEALAMAGFTLAAWVVEPEAAAAWVGTTTFWVAAAAILVPRIPIWNRGDCDHCGHDDYKPVYLQSGHETYTCTNCGTINYDALTHGR